jgi:hypothetical protein
MKSIGARKEKEKKKKKKKKKGKARRQPVTTHLAHPARCFDEIDAEPLARGALVVAADEHCELGGAVARRRRGAVVRVVAAIVKVVKGRRAPVVIVVAAREVKANPAAPGV